MLDLNSSNAIFKIVVENICSIKEKKMFYTSENFRRIAVSVRVFEKRPGPHTHTVTWLSSTQNINSKN